MRGRRAAERRRAPGRGDGPYRPGAPSVSELSAGAVVVDPPGERVLLLHQSRDDRWCLPKGHVDPGESLEEAALRETREEAGLAVALGPEVAASSYRFFRERGRQNVHKTSVYFLARAKRRRVTLEPIFDRAEWLAWPEAARRVRYAEDRDVLKRARRIARARARRSGRS